MTPLLLPSPLFNVEYALDGGPNRDGRGYGPFEAPANLSFCFVCHTTETPGVPYYSGGVHPHLTYVPGGRWVQHLPFDRRAGTLRGTSTTENGRKVPTNRANAIQVEICAYSDYKTAAKYGRLAVRDLPESDRQELARFVRYIYDEFATTGQPLTWYPYSYTRMTHAKWLPSDGKRMWFVCDHLTAPDDSTHWDCGAIDRGDIMARAVALGDVGPSDPPPPPDPMTDWPNLMRYGDHHPAVRELRDLLYRAGYRAYSFDHESFGWAVRWAVKRFQAKVGLIDPRYPDPSKDGVVGPKTRAALRPYL